MRPEVIVEVAPETAPGRERPAGVIKEIAPITRRAKGARPVTEVAPLMKKKGAKKPRPEVVPGKKSRY
jgi:hypothetical protein